MVKRVKSQSFVLYTVIKCALFFSLKRSLAIWKTEKMLSYLSVPCLLSGEYGTMIHINGSFFLFTVCKTITRLQVLNIADLMNLMRALFAGNNI